MILKHAIPFQVPGIPIYELLACYMPYKLNIAMLDMVKSYKLHGVVNQHIVTLTITYPSIHSPFHHQQWHISLL